MTAMEIIAVTCVRARASKGAQRAPTKTNTNEHRHKMKYLFVLKFFSAFRRLAPAKGIP
jgi:hypothetical protein